MDPSLIRQIIFGVLLVIILAGMAVFFATKQWRVLRHLRTSPDIEPEERTYSRNQALRRLASCVLMLVLAGLLASHFSFEGKAQELYERAKDNEAKGEAQPPNPEEQQFVWFYARFWIVVLLVVLGLIGLAAMDVFAIRRYGLRHYRQIQADRRAMIESELARIRSVRNGHL